MTVARRHEPYWNDPLNLFRSRSGKTQDVALGDVTKVTRIYVTSKNYYSIIFVHVHVHCMVKKNCYTRKSFSEYFCAVWLRTKHAMQTHSTKTYLFMFFEECPIHVLAKCPFFMQNNPTTLPRFCLQTQSG